MLIRFAHLSEACERLQSRGGSTTRNLQEPTGICHAVALRWSQGERDGFWCLFPQGTACQCFVPDSHTSPRCASGFNPLSIPPRENYKNRREFATRWICRVREMSAMTFGGCSRRERRVNVLSPIRPPLRGARAASIPCRSTKRKSHRGADAPL